MDLKYSQREIEKHVLLILTNTLQFLPITITIFININVFLEKNIESRAIQETMPIIYLSILNLDDVTQASEPVVEDISTRDADRLPKLERKYQTVYLRLQNKAIPRLIKLYIQIESLSRKKQIFTKLETIRIY